MPDDRKLNIVDEAGNIIGIDTRENIHQQGLLHRETHVWFYTPKGEIIFQHRAKDKDTYPDLLDASVGGHVEIGSDYLKTALAEVAEETGLKITADDLRFITMVRSKNYDPVTKKTNNALRAIYAYLFLGKISDLRLEPGKIIGFEAWSLEKIFNISEMDKKLFIPSIFDPEVLEIFRKIQESL